MPGRHTNSGNYRFGYNGMELDPEVKGDGNSYTTEFRQYDPRLGRWLSLDPLMQKFPSVSPYVAFANNPIWYSDPYGLAPTGGDKKGGESSTGKKSSGPGIWQVLKNISTKTVSTLKSLKQAVTRTGYKLFPMHKELEEFVVTPSKNPPVEEAGCPVLIPGPYVAPPTPAPLTVIAGGAAEEVAVAVGADALKLLGLTLSFILYSEEGYNPESGMNPEQQPVPDYVQEKDPPNPRKQFYYVTYTMKSKYNNDVYVGRSSGYGDPNKIVERRMRNHHMKRKGFKDGVLDVSIPAKTSGGYWSRRNDPSYHAIRGIEQIMIKIFDSQGISANGMRGVADNNPLRETYQEAAIEALKE